MSDERANEAGAVWKGQPWERRAVNLEQIVKRSTEELEHSTRSEILMSIGATVLFVTVMAWRLAPYRDSSLAAIYGAGMVWAAVTLYWFQRRIWRRPAERPDAVAASGLEYYRRELEQRRDHLRRAWIWYGPLAVACVVTAVVLGGHTFTGYRPVSSVAPLLVLLAAWVGFGFWRRHRQVKEIQREIDGL